MLLKRQLKSGEFEIKINNSIIHHCGYQYMIPKLPHLIKFIETVFTFDKDIFMIVHNINNNRFSFTLNQITFRIYIKFKVH